MHRSEDIGLPAKRERVYTVAEAREVDRRCVEEFGIPSILLMEHAAIGIVEVIGRVAPVGPVLIFVGPGNNGGDGLAVARLLSNADRKVACVVVADLAKFRPGGDAAINLRIAEEMRVPLLPAGDNVKLAVARAIQELGPPLLIIDALLGTGLDRGVGGVMAAAIAEINAMRRLSPSPKVLAIDVPSGMNADSGVPWPSESGRPGPVVRADVTVTLLGLKHGYLTLAAGEFLGDCFVASIGAPGSLVRSLGCERSPASHGDKREGPMQKSGSDGAGSAESGSGDWPRG